MRLVSFVLTYRGVDAGAVLSLAGERRAILDSNHYGLATSLGCDPSHPKAVAVNSTIAGSYAMPADSRFGATNR